MKSKRSLKAIIAALIVAVSLILFAVLLLCLPSSSDYTGDAAYGSQGRSERTCTYMVYLLPSVAICGGVYLLYLRQEKR